MKSLLPSTAAAAAVLAGALFLSASGGAVAGSMVTGKQIRDGTVTAKDVKDRSLGAADLSPDALSALKGPPGVAGLPGVTGLETVTVHTADVAPGDTGNATAICPAGKKALGGAGYWDNGYAGAAYPLLADRWNVGGKNPGATSATLYGYVVCGIVG